MHTEVGGFKKLKTAMFFQECTQPLCLVPTSLSFSKVRMVRFVLMVT